MLFFRELFKPALKCNRVGHKIATKIQECYVYPSDAPYWHVADRVIEEQKYCPRCGHLHSDWTVVKRTGIDSLSMDSIDWKHLKESGKIPAY